MTDARNERRGGLEAALANGHALLARDPRGAAEQAVEILRVDAQIREAHQLLAAALRRLGQTGQAEQAELNALRLFAHDPALREAAAHLAAGRFQEAERRLRPHLERRPGDLAAKAMLAEAFLAAGLLAEAERLFREVLALLPSFPDAQLGLADALFQAGRQGESLETLDRALAANPGALALAEQKGATLGHLGDYDTAASLYEELLRRNENAAPIWLAYGNVLKTLGRQQEAIAAYRRVLALQPDAGEAWWSLANLKTVKLEPADRPAMEKLLGRADLGAADRTQIHFALGKRLEDEGESEAAFRHYEEGNRLRRAQLPYSAAETSEEVTRAQALFTPEFLASREGRGDPARDPIFILGMPRAGSTLVEQILASHSEVEGTSELPYIGALARGLVAERWATQDAYPDLLASLPPERLADLGADYLARARPHRKTQRPFFIDKMPNNWRDTGFIHLILPNARIVDVRRNPLDCGVSNFRQYFAQGQAFSYSLEDIGAWYRDYVGLMDHFDAVLPGRVHRLIYEDMIADPEQEVRRLLDYIGLPFQAEVRRFHENRRAVRTASSEQVRRPINRDGVDRWKAYEDRLEPLEAALGPALGGWRGAHPSLPKEERG